MIEKKRRMISLWGLICGTIVIILMCLMFKPTASDKFIDIIHSDSERVFTQEELADYRKQIEEELAMIENRKSFGQIYYTLGVLCKLEGNHEQAYTHFISALDYSLLSEEKLRGNIYKELAVSSVNLGKLEDVGDYFQQSELIAKNKKDSNLQAALYSEVAQSLMQNTNFFHTALYLLEQTVGVAKDTNHEARVGLLLSKVYQIAGLYDLSINQLNKVLEVSQENEYNNLELQALAQLSIAYYLTNQLEQSLQFLQAYFSMNPIIDDLAYLYVYTDLVYKIEGYEYARQEIKNLQENDAALFSSQIREEKSTIINLLYASIMCNEERYEEGLMYLQKNDSLTTITQVEVILQLWSDKLMTDLQRKHNKDQLYIDDYTSQLARCEQIIGKGNMMPILSDDIMKSLVELEDYKTVYYHYLSRNQPVQKELQNLIPVGEQVAVAKDMVNRKISTERLLAIIGYLSSLLLGAGVGYVIYRYGCSIRSLKNMVRESKGIDPLTQTLTKAALYLQLEDIVGQDKMSHFLLLEVDDFGSFNETFGYLAGDTVLKAMADVLRNNFPDSYISRHYGVQFIIVTHMTEVELSDTIALLVQEVVIHQQISGKRDMTLSMGVSSGYLNTTLDIDKHIKLASNKLRISKQRGCGICTF